MRNATVIIPTYGRAKLLASLLDTYLAQDNVARVIIVDDGSAVPVSDFVTESRRVSLVRHPRSLGLPAARNTGLAMADTEFVVFGEDDAYFEAGYVAKLLAYLQERPMDLAVGRLIRLLPEESDAQALQRLSADRGDVFDRVFINVVSHRATCATRVPFAHALMAGRTELFMSLQFSTRLGGPSFMGEDRELQLQAIKRGGSVWVLPDTNAFHLARTTTTGGVRPVSSDAVRIVSNALNLWLVQNDSIREMQPFFPGLTPDSLRRRSSYGAALLEVKRTVRARSPLIDRLICAVRSSGSDRSSEA